MNNIFLIGPPASGKTSVGISLAEHMDLPFVDTDEQIAEAEGEGVVEIFNRRGERSFREIERDMIKSICEDHNSSVISTGGGAVLSSRTRKIMKESGTIITLLPSIRAIQTNVEKSHLRPSLLSTTAEALRSLLIQRMPYYLMADYVVSYDTESVGDLVSIVEKFVLNSGFTQNTYATHTNEVEKL